MHLRYNIKQYGNLVRQRAFLYGVLIDHLFSQQKPHVCTNKMESSY